MFKRIEFSLNLDDPQEAHLYRALLPSLRYRRGGAIIRQALTTFFGTEDQPQTVINSHSQEKPENEQR